MTRLKQHSVSFKLSEARTSRALHSFNHDFSKFGVPARFEQPVASEKVTGTIETDFAFSELTKAQVVPRVAGSLFSPCDFDLL